MARLSDIKVQIKVNMDNMVTIPEININTDHLLDLVKDYSEFYRIAWLDAARKILGNRIVDDAIMELQKKEEERISKESLRPANAPRQARGAEWFEN